MRAVVIGAGLVGSLCAWARMLRGDSITIYSADPPPPPPRGFVYLHDPCELPLTTKEIRVMSVGTAEGYARKVYSDPNHETSFSQYNHIDNLRGWSPAEALELLGQLLPVPKCKRFNGFQGVVKGVEADVIIITIPAPALFHDVAWPYVEASVDLEQVSIETPNLCVYSGDPGTPWQRAGVMFGWGFREYPSREGEYLIKKVIPIDNHIPASPGVMLAGRYGTWTKELAHESFRRALEYDLQL